MNLDTESWGFEETELNELRFAAIQSLQNCVSPRRLCISCRCNRSCELMFLHDAMFKLGCEIDKWTELNKWASDYYHKHPRA